MYTIQKLISGAIALSISLISPPFATADVDLSAQRGEKQYSLKVPGEKIDHHGIIINPTPRNLVMKDGASLNISKGFKPQLPKAFTKAITKDLDKTEIPISKKGVPLIINSDSKDGVNPVNGAYILDISPDKVTIDAYDADGVFFALQTLRQLLSSPAVADGTIPCMRISDFPNLQYRGLVEGFYGTPWSHSTRMSLIDFLGDYKMNTYIYGPKDDPYHSSPYWRLPYPEKEAQQIKQLVDEANDNHVNFVWAIHPGKDIQWNQEDYQNLLNKFNEMYGLGVRSFAIFFDDIEGIGTDSRRQTELLNNLTEDFVKVKGDVDNLMICPTDYSQLWANPDMENGQLAVYGKTLDPGINVFWTGAVVCSDLTPETLDFIDTRIKRPALYWWNFPVTDYVRNFILQGPSYGLDTSLTSDQVSGIVSNPMEHGEASKIALYGVGDYSWNTSDYNPIDSWERAIEKIAPEAPEAYRTFAIHNADTHDGYRRDESWETPIFKFDNYTPEEFETLRLEFEKISRVPEEMQKISNKALLNELNPWLQEFGKLGERGLNTLDLIKIYETGNDSAFLAAYTENIMTPEEREAYDAHKVGTYKLQPFYEDVMDDIITAYYQRATIPPLPGTPASYVNPFIGTSNFGATNPGAVTPNGMMSVTPFNVMGSDLNKFDKDERWWSMPYEKENKYFTGYAHVALSGVGCPELSSILTMATTGDLMPDYHDYGSEYTDEIAIPGYYRNKLTKYDIITEATATPRTSSERYTFPEGKGNIILNLGEGLTNESGATLKKVSDTEIEGFKLMGTFCYTPQAVFPIYFVARVDRKPTSSGYWKKQPLKTGPEADWDPDDGEYKLYPNYHREISGDDIGYWWSFDNLKEGEQVEVKIGVSFVSMENARKNLNKEQAGLTFDAMRTLAYRQWNDELSRIRVKGGTDEDKTIFYTALYHSLLHPNILSDVNGQYPRMESAGNATANYDRYTVFSLWDTYRNLHQLLTLVYPEKQLDMARSVAAMAGEGGWLPRWELYGKETYTMEGDPAIPMLIDTYRKGLTDFPIRSAYNAMKKSATTPGKDNPIRPDIDPYIEKGYIPMGYFAADMSGDNSVSHALEYYVADNALAWLADEFGESEFADQLRERASGWKNYYSQESGTFRPLDKEGNFMKGFKPEQGMNFEPVTGFHEGSAWNYTFYVPFDVEGLTQIMGGEANFISKLQKVFDKDLYDPTNEPDINYPYLFSRFPGEEWRTQKEVNRLLNRYYKNSPDGLPGNDDTGTMSAWAVFSMMGLYPDSPGEPYYTLTSPVFDEIDIVLPEGELLKITTDRKNAGDIYIDSMTLGGKPLNSYRITHTDLLEGKHLNFKLK